VSRRLAGAAAPAPLGRRSLRVCMIHLSDVHVDSRIQRQAHALAARGDEVDLVCLSPDGELTAASGRIRIHGIPCGKAAGGAGAYVKGYGEFLARAAVRVARLHARRRFDLVEAHNMPDAVVFAAIVPKLAGTPVILNVHDTFPELFATKFEGRRGAGLVGRVLRLEERASARVADAVVTVTAEARDLLSARGSGTGRTTVVMNSPDEAVFGAPRQPSPLPAAGPLRLIYHGGVAPRFGVEVLVRAVGAAAAAGADITLRVCGTGDAEDRARLNAVAAEHAPRLVDIAPRPIAFKKIPAELEQAHAGVVPTLRDPFTELLLPVKLMEYVHMGLPVVTSRLPVVERHFSDEQVRFAAPGSVEELTAALTDLHLRRDAARARAVRAADALTPIAWSRQRRAYLTLVDSLVRRRGVEAQGPVVRSLTGPGRTEIGSNGDRASHTDAQPA
jgi:glycosyltransferase involved in cell wall biosynthesis